MPEGTPVRLADNWTAGLPAFRVLGAVTVRTGAILTTVMVCCPERAVFASNVAFTVTVVLLLAIEEGAMYCAVSGPVSAPIDPQGATAQETDQVTAGSVF